MNIFIDFQIKYRIMPWEIYYNKKIMHYITRLFNPFLKCQMMIPKLMQVHLRIIYLLRVEHGTSAKQRYLICKHGK
jgi:hypothetical protein